MFWTLLTAVLGMFIVVGFWFIIQAAARTQSKCGSDKDALEHMAHGCAGCQGSGACRNRAEAHHELV